MQSGSDLGPIEQQLRILHELRGALRVPADEKEAYCVLVQFRAHRDLFASIAEDIDALLGDHTGSEATVASLGAPHQRSEQPQPGTGPASPLAQPKWGKWVGGLALVSAVLT